MSVSKPATTNADVWDAVVVGAGFAGLYAVHKLVSLGFSVLGVEKAAGVGGVWYWNRYPGARCDCESYYYSYSFSEELQRDWKWSLRYSEQPEILNYLEYVAQRFDLHRHIRFSTRVDSATFDEQTNRWTVRLGNGESVVARFIVTAAGCLSAIQPPGIPGLDNFKGRVLYSAAWPHESVDLHGKRVGIIGTGASGVQVISRIAPDVEHLFVFQRTANWVIPVWNGPMGAEFAAWVETNYADIRRRCSSSAGGVPFEPPQAAALSADPSVRQQILEKFWAFGGIRFFSAFSDTFSAIEANELVCSFVRDYIRRTVRDPETAERLIPNDHPIGTKRPPMDDTYYETFNRSNVTLVDIRKNPITGCTDRAIQTSSASFDLDVLILATGFDALTGALLAMDLRGRNGVRLADAWANGARTYLGLGVAGFPNLFTITGPLSPSVLANMPTAIEQHVNWIADCLCYLRTQQLETIEPSGSAQDEWTAHVEAVASQTLYPRSNSWYFGSNVPGKPRQFGVYVGGFGAYSERCQAVAESAYEGFALG